MKWRVSYTHNKMLPGQVWSCEVEAPDEFRANMRAGMVRAEDFVTWFTKDFYRPNIVTWTRVKTEMIEDDQTMA